MPEELPVLDALSEMVVLSSLDNTKNLIITAIETHGPFDDEAMRQAIRQAAESFPQIHSCLREVRRCGMHRLVRQPRKDLPLPVFVSSQEGSETPGMDGFLKMAAPRLDRDWNLFEELPAEFHFVKLAHDHHLVVPVIHHVAADAGVASEFGREFLAHYHMLVTGREPEWAGSSPAMSTSRKRMVRRRKASWTRFLQDGKKALTNLLERPSLPRGTGSPKDTGQYHVRRVLSAEDSAKLARIPSMRTVSLVDLFAAAANLSVDRWNSDRLQPTGKLTTSMSVNMKGRFRGMDRPNNSALLFFGSQPHERTDPGHFVRTLALSRIKQFRNQMDFTFFEDVGRLNASVRLLPFSLRRKIVHHLITQHQYSVAITLLGVVWPEFKNGRPTGGTVLTHSGDLEITQVYGLGYKLLSSTRLLFIVYGFRGMLNVELAASACLFTREEAESFMDLTLETLLNYSERLSGQ